MQRTHLVKAGTLCLVLILCSLVCWELYWRSQGFQPTYNDDKVLWASSRKEVYRLSDRATVFIGASRIKFDLDIPTWERLTGEKAIQLAIVGTSCMPTLQDLANDERFKGKLIIDVIESVLFSGLPRDKSALDAISYYHKETPAQKMSSFIDYGLESRIVFLEEGKFGLNSFLYRLKIPNRPGAMGPPDFPKEFSVTTFDRQNHMTPMFLADPQLQKIQIGNWTARGSFRKTPGLTGKSLDTVFEKIKTSIDKIRSRGGQVLFVRPPSNGGYWENECLVYPRGEYWDRLLKYTGCAGVHFKDYPVIRDLTCPEWSHLSPQDAVVFTRHLVEIIHHSNF